MVIHHFSGRFAIVRLPPDAAVPTWLEGGFWSATRTRDELSIVVPESRLPAGVDAKRDWSLLGVQGPLDFSLVGVLASLSAVLADAGISLFAVSTFDTDYLLVPAGDVERAIEVLRRAGHTVLDEQGDGDLPGKATSGR